MADFLTDRTQLNLIFPAKEPSIFNEIHSVAERTFIYPGECVLLVLSLRFTGDKQDIESQKLWRNSARKLRVSSCSIDAACHRMDNLPLADESYGVANYATKFTESNNKKSQMDNNKQFKECRPFATYNNGAACNKQITVLVSKYVYMNLNWLNYK